LPEVLLSWLALWWQTRIFYVSDGTIVDRWPHLGEKPPWPWQPAPEYKLGYIIEEGGHSDVHVCNLCLIRGLTNQNWFCLQQRKLCLQGFVDQSFVCSYHIISVVSYSAIYILVEFACWSHIYVDLLFRARG